MNKQPLVSILMTAYNRSQYIAEAIESVLNSSYTKIELIIVDDCSTDNTVEIASSYLERDERIKVFRNKNNLGDYPNRNKAASYAKGKYLKYLDSDDLIYPYGLAVMVEGMELFPKAGFGLMENAFNNRPQPVFLSPHEAYKENFLVRDLFGRSPGSSIIKSEAFRIMGGFSGKRQIGDAEFWLAIARKFPMITLQRDLVWDRTHGEQEKMYDSETDKSVMRFKLQINALQHQDCPLTKKDITVAFKRIKKSHIKTFARMTVQGEGIFAAINYYSKMRSIA